MNRRKFLKIIGGGTVLAATAIGAPMAVIATRQPKTALQPWAMAGQYTEPRMQALSYALLAPNPHNRQPWLVDLTQAGRIILYADPTRLLPETDPFNRQITIGLGCFLELLRMGAAQNGQRAEMQDFPEGTSPAGLDTRPVAVIDLVPDASIRPDPLFAHVLARRSLKTPNDMAKPVPEALLPSLRAAAIYGPEARTTLAPPLRQTLRDLTSEAMAIEFATDRVYHESVELFRIGAAEVDANPDGITFTGPLFEIMHSGGLFTREAALDRSSSTYTQGVTLTLDAINSAMGYIWLTTEGNSRHDQLNAGRDWVRINLATTAAGLGLHPLSQALQEYPEMQATRAALHTALQASDKTVQMFGRLGYAPASAPKPRWPLEARISEG